MTPDMKRLCEAAASEWTSLPIDHEYHTISDNPADWQGIVGAVLGSLFTRSFVEAIARRYENGDPSECLSVLSLEMAIDDEISTILAEPAKA